MLVECVIKFIEGYVCVQGVMWLVVCGLLLVIVNLVVVVKCDQVMVQLCVVLLFNILLYLFVFMLFIGGMYLVIDFIVGECEW